MRITDIVMQKNNTKRYSIFIDEKFCFGMSDIDVLYYNLKIGSEISQAKYDEILENLIYQKAKDRALTFISYRLRSEKEIFDKLKNDYSEEIIEKVISMLKKYNYIDDKNFAFSFTKDKVNLRKDGKNKIRFNLKLKGIDDSVIDEIFDEFDFNEHNIIKYYLNKKVKSKSDYRERQKIYNYLVHKGFTSESIKECLDIYFTKDITDTYDLS